MPSPILARADALMQRRRQSTGENDEIPVLTDTLDDEIPVLLDSDEPSSEHDAPYTETTPTAVQTEEIPLLTPAQLELVISEVVRRIEQRLGGELPGMIEASVRSLLKEQEIQPLA